MIITCYRDGRIVFARRGYYAPEAMTIISGPARLLRRAVLAFKGRLARRLDRYRREAAPC